MFLNYLAIVFFVICVSEFFIIYRIYNLSKMSMENYAEVYRSMEVEITLLKNKILEKEKVELLLANWIIGITDDELDAEDYEDDCAYIESKEILERQQYVQG